MALEIGVKELLEAGVHFGHQTKKWNPQMKPFIFDARHNIHIIDLTQTITQLEAACNYLANTVREGGEILFVGTKKQAQAAVRDCASSTGQLYITQRWLGGALTNFNTVKKSIGRLNKIEKMVQDGTISKYGKKEQSSLRREMQRLITNLDGMRDMKRYPKVMFIIDLKKEHNAVAEARKLNIPIVGLCDTNADPTLCEIAVAGNDDSIRSIRVILNCIQKAIADARSEFESIQSRRKQEAEQVPTTTTSRSVLVGEVDPIIDPAAAEAPAEGEKTGESPESAPQATPSPAPISIENFEPVGPTGPAATASQRQKEKDEN
jgi:small subunit ribosomal protein S2